MVGASFGFPDGVFYKALPRAKEVTFVVPKNWSCKGTPPTEESPHTVFINVN